MFKFLFGIIVLLGFILLLTGAIGIRFLRAIFGFGKRSESHRNQQSRTSRPPKNSDKVFGDDVGEYVDFEEIDEDSDTKSTEN